MNKVLAEIIAGMIPCKMARNRWRGILRYGLINAVKLRQRLRFNISEPTRYLSVCAIAKNEGEYFKEWLDWHIAKGVDKFYIYDNDSTDNTKEVLAPYIAAGIVEYNEWRGYRRQLAAYDDCMERHRFSNRWIAFIDLDEFIEPLADSSIPEFLSRFENFAAVEVNWLCFGSSGENEKSSEPVTERFKYHSVGNHRLNRHVKSFVNPRRVYTMIGCHEAARITKKAADSHGNVITKNFRDREPQQDIIRINHYAVKSLQEFREKQAKGRASGKVTFIDMDYFEQYDLNDIKDN